MAAVGIFLSWIGYSVFFYGLDTVTGGNDSFVSLAWPGRYTPTARDGANPSSNGANPHAGPPGTVVPPNTSGNPGPGVAIVQPGYGVGPGGRGYGTGSGVVKTKPGDPVGVF